MENEKEPSCGEISLCKYPKGMPFGMKSWNFNLLQCFGFNSVRGKRGIVDDSKCEVNLERHRIHVNGQSNRDFESNDENDTGSGADARCQKWIPNEQLVTKIPIVKDENENVTDERVKNEEHVF